MDKNENTLCRMWYQRTRVLESRPAFMEKHGGQFARFTYQDFYDAVKDLAMGFRHSGLVRGDRIAILSENRKEWAIVDMACQCLGIVNVPVYPTLPPGEAAEILAHCDCRWVIASSLQQFEKLVLVRERLPKVEKVVMLDSLGEHSEEKWVQNYSDLSQMGLRGPKADEILVEEIDKSSPDDTVTIIYTSGTTGFPKGVMLSHGNFLSNAIAMTKAIKTDSSDVTLSFLPLSHAFERTAGLYHMMYKGIPIAYAESLDTIVKDMGLVRPTIMLGVPRFYEKMQARTLEAVRAGSIIKRLMFHWALGVGKKVRRKERDGKEPGGLLQKRYDTAQKLVFSKLRNRLGGHLRFFVSGGAPLPADVGNFFGAAGITIIEGYGITECAPVVAVNRLENNQIGTVGIPVDGVTVKIAGDGEILVKGPNVMQGYYKMNKATNEVLKDGWYHTGDLGSMADDGFLSITGRKKDIIVNSYGKNISPRRIEDPLKSDRYIADAIAHGDKRKFLTAIIVPDFEQLENLAKSRGIKFKDHKELASSDEIHRFYLQRVAHHNRKLASFEKVRKFVLADAPFSMDAGEVTPTMKLRRKKIEARFAKHLDAMYAEKAKG